MLVAGVEPGTPGVMVALQARLENKTTLYAQYPVLRSSSNELHHWQATWKYVVSHQSKWGNH